MHTIRKQKANTPFFALKIDMMKAYDRVEWSYLKGVMCKLGFSAEWVTTTMRCVTNVRYAVRVNGELSESFIPTRGLRQGDPISPYLFLLCAERLSCLIQQREQGGTLKGVKNGRLGPTVSHLLLQMIVFSLQEGILKTCKLLMKCSTSIVKVQAKELTSRNLQFTLKIIVQSKSNSVLRQFLMFRMRVYSQIILVCHLG
jgi:hypothetical protein